MDISTVRNGLLPYVGVFLFVRIVRTFPSHRSCNGFVLAVGEELVLMHQVEDFQPNGYVVLRLADIVDVVSGENQRTYERILEGEGYGKAIGLPFNLPLGNVRAVLTALHSRDRNIVVECEGLISDDNEFYIGRVLFIGFDLLEFEYFDANGRWDTQVDSINITAITQIAFDTHYINVFSKYLDGPCPF